MEKKNNQSQTLCIEELVKQRPILTEEEKTKSLKFYKIYDCGLIRYVKTRNVRG